MHKMTNRMELRPDLFTSTGNAPGILVVDDHDLLRLGLHTLVSSYAAAAGCAVRICEARTLQEALALYRSEMQNIGLVLLDMHLPDAHGLTGLVTFKQQFPCAHIVILSGITDLALMHEALAQGAQAYLTKSGNLQQVVDYIKSLGMFGAADGVAVPLASGSESAYDSIAETSRFFNTRDQTVGLTPRQTQVLEWILAGKPNREIAQVMSLSEGTIKNYTSTLMLQFGVRSRAQLITLLR